jgi:hypothetical protein
MGFLKNIVGTVTGAVSGLAGTVTSTVQGVLPAVSNLANTPAGMGALGAFIGKAGGSTEGFTKSSNAVLQSVDIENSNVKTAARTSGDGITTPLTGLRKFFNYYKTNNNDLYELDQEGKKQLNTNKIIGHILAASTIVIIVYKIGKVKRWW